MSPFLSRRRRPPLSPEAQALLQMTGGARGPMSRRALLGGVGALGAGAALSACAPPAPPSALAEVKLPTDRSEQDKTVLWANWTGYMDTDEGGRHPTLDAFEKKTGIRVTYAEDIDDNDTYFAKVRPQLQQGQDIKRDIFTPTDWMAARVIRDQLVQPLDLMALPHVVYNLLDPLRNVSFDPGRAHSVTWQSGFAGIGYNRKKVGRELRTLDDLFDPNPKQGQMLKGRITVLSEYRDTLGLVMQSQGVDIESDWGKEQFDNALAWIEQKVQDGWIRKVKGNDYMVDMVAGNTIAGITWSGDIFTVAADSGDDSWTFTLPESGGTLWSDNLMIPITATHRANAHKLIDYYYEPAVAAELAAWVNYVCPVKGAQAEMEKIDPELAESPNIFPSDAYLKDHNVQQFRVLTAQEDTDYAAVWMQKVMGS